MEKKMPKTTSLKDDVFMKTVLVFLTALIVINTAVLFKPESLEVITKTPKYIIDQPGNTTNINDSFYYSNETENLYDSDYGTNYHNTSNLNETNNLYDSDYETNYHNTSYLNETNNLYDTDYNTEFYNTSHTNTSDHLYNTFHNDSYSDIQDNDSYYESYYNYSYLNDTDITGNGITYNITQTNNTYYNYTNIYYNTNTTYYNTTTTGTPTQPGHNNSETFFIDRYSWNTSGISSKKAHWTIDFGHNVSEIWVMAFDYSDSIPIENASISFDAYKPYTSDPRENGFYLETDTLHKFEIPTDCMTLYTWAPVWYAPELRWLSAPVSIIVFGNW